MPKSEKELAHARDMFHTESHFKPTPCHRLNYRYTAKVWLFSIFLGTTLYFTLKSYKELSGTEIGSIGGSSTVFYYVFTMVMALVISLPCPVIFVLSHHFIVRFVFSAFRIKCVLSVVGQILCWGAFYVGFGMNSLALLSKNMDIILPYALATAISIIIFNLSSEK